MKNVLSFVVFIVAFIVVKYGIQEYRDYSNAATVENEYEQLKAEAMSSSGGTSGDAIYLAAQKLSTKAIENYNSEREKRLYAANFFFGYYFMNMRSRKYFCKALGVDIAPFLNSFAQLNKSEQQSAATIYAQYEQSKEELWLVVKPVQAEQMAQNMQEAADTYRLTIKETCELFVDYPEMALDMKFNTRAPANVYQVLMGSKSVN